MLITHVTNNDKDRWLNLSRDFSLDIVKEQTHDPLVFWRGFHEYMDRRIEKFEAFQALDRMTGKCLGIVAFSKANNRISFIGVSREASYSEAGEKLVNAAINQLNGEAEIRATLLRSDAPHMLELKEIFKRSGFSEEPGEISQGGVPACSMKRQGKIHAKRASFHHNYSRFMDWQETSGCPVCCDLPGPSDNELIKELEYSWVEASINAQGCLWGKCHVLSKKHFVEFHDIPPENLANFSADVQKAGKVLKEVSRAVKINYELHGNSLPHLHVHLFPRYIDDLFPGQGIDVNKISPSPYTSREEFDFFINEMRKKLD